MECSVKEDNSNQHTKDIETTLQLAKLDPKDLVPLTQVIYFTSDELHNNNYKLLQLDNELLEVFVKQESVFIKGDDNENAVICTDSATYDVLETETSNSLLLAESLQFKDDIVDHDSKSTSTVSIRGIFYDYLELQPAKPNLHKLHQLLNTSLYKGPEYEKEENNFHLYTYTELLNVIQASQKELDKALESMHIIKINNNIRLLDFEYHFRILSYMLKLIDENSWRCDEIDYELTLDTLSDLVPTEVISSVFELYTVESKVIDGLQLYMYKEAAVCKFFAQVLLHNAGKFNYQEFLQAWKESVPEGMEPEVEMLYGIAIIDTKSVPNVIRAFEEEKLPDNIIERFDVLFHAKDRWTVPEITPYIQPMTTAKADVNAILAKYARACTYSGVKYYTAKHLR